MPVKERIFKFLRHSKRIEAAIAQNIGYFNGICPKCHTHIGTYVMRSLGQNLITCAACNYVWTITDGDETAQWHGK